MLSQSQSVDELCSNVRNRFEKSIKNFHLDNTDWRRLAYAYELASGDSVLDVGTGHGVLLHLLADSGKYSQITGFDIRTHSQAILREDVTYLTGSIGDANLNLPVHDTVICMEVIEHLEEKYNEVMLRNLRAAAKKRLVVTVPYEEPEPVWWHDKPGGHRQSFSLEKISQLFPTAIAARFPRYGVDWIFIVEDIENRSSEFAITSLDDLRSQRIGG